MLGNDQGSFYHDPVYTIGHAGSYFRKRLEILINFQALHMTPPVVLFVVQYNVRFNAKTSFSVINQTNGLSKRNKAS
jgi:hypothetical protein